LVAGSNPARGASTLLFSFENIRSRSRSSDLFVKKFSLKASVRVRVRPSAPGQIGITIRRIFFGNAHLFALTRKSWLRSTEPEKFRRRTVLISV
jgi:hypothetical protein